eukprot:5248014-Pleurochrysis_carterae.AAC.1
MPLLPVPDHQRSIPWTSRLPRDTAIEEENAVEEDIDDQPDDPELVQELTYAKREFGETMYHVAGFGDELFYTDPADDFTWMPNSDSS